MNEDPTPALLHRPPQIGERVTYIDKTGAWIEGICLEVHECLADDGWTFLDLEETIYKATIAEYNAHKGVRSWEFVEPFDPGRHDGSLDFPASETYVLGWRNAGEFITDEDTLLYECERCGFGPTVLYQRSSRAEYVTAGTTCHADCHECGMVTTWRPVDEEPEHQEDPKMSRAGGSGTLGP